METPTSKPCYVVYRGDTRYKVVMEQPAEGIETLDWDRFYDENVAALYIRLCRANNLNKKTTGFMVVLPSKYCKEYVRYHNAVNALKRFEGSRMFRKIEGKWRRC